MSKAKKFFILPSILRNFYQKFLKDEILLFAQGLTYNTLLTIIPLLGLVVSLGRSFLQEDLVIQQSFLFFANYLSTEALIQVMERIISLLENLKKFPLGKFSLFFYFIMSLGLLFQLEDALNRIFLSLKRRSLKERILFYWIVLTLSPFIFFLPVLLQASFKPYLSYQLIFYFLFLLLFFFLLYIYFPARRVKKLASIKGALFATILWYGFSLLFGLYVKKAIGYSKLYGGLSVFPIFLIFVFLNWLIFLIGAEITYFLEKKPWKKKIITLSSPFKEFFILLYLTRYFYRGQSLSLETLDKGLPFSEEDILQAVRELEKRGLLFLRDEEIFFRIPPDRILIRDLFSESTFKEWQESQEISSLLADLCPLKEEVIQRSLKDCIDLLTNPSPGR
jgi:membrane protein